VAKITDLKFKLKGEDLSIPVNCNSGGQFTCNIPAQVSLALNIQSKLMETNLDTLRTKFYDAIERYRNAETKQELFILIRYASSGRYSEKENGYPLFGGYRHPYLLGGGSSFNDNNLDGLGFEFEVAISETIDGVTNWFHAEIKDEGNALLFPELKFVEHDPSEYIKGSRFYHPENYKKIPFSNTALKTLKVAQEKIRQASEMLFNFIEQDEEQILLTLTSQKLLN
jgi:hypothetical protein